MTKDHISIPLEKLAAWNPFMASPWGKSVSKKQVSRCISSNDLEARHGTKNHAQRIAYLVLMKDDKPIEIDIGMNLSWHPICDGNHRLAAAFYRNDEFIPAIVSGSLELAALVFGVDCRQY